MRLVARGLGERELERRRRHRLAAALVLEREHHRRQRQLPRGEPAAELHDEPPRDEQHGLRVFDALRQFEPRVEHGRHRHPGERLHGVAVCAVERGDERGTAAARESRARQAAQIGERAAAEAVEPAGVRARVGQQLARQRVERARERRRPHDAPPRARLARRTREQPRAAPRRRGGDARRIAERGERRPHLPAQQRQPAEQPQARADVDDERRFVVERDARREAQQRERDRAQRVGLARRIAFDEPRAGRERQHAAALHAGTHAVRARGRIGDQHDALLEHRAAVAAVRRRRRAHVERQARQMDAEQGAHSGSPRWATAIRAQAARRAPARGA
ncbi:hypothetical protein X978_2824 [Burkholderia pseudomallei MSHR3965]|nr:hypothetical protein X978_2824 [Burkholderia pseudomallei MSHR3965]